MDTKSTDACEVCSDGIFTGYTESRICQIFSYVTASGKEAEQQWLWKQALSVNMEDIIYIHLHQRDESSPSSLTLVNCDGVQCPPLQMSAGQHSLVFLATLESVTFPEKSLPRLRKRTTAVGSGAMLDYVFRIVRVGGNDFLPTYRHEDEEDARSPPTVER
ncbi:hypothetical protein OSTOST_05826 [Ostertagia ostertagi]